MEKIQNGKFISFIYDLFKVESDGKETLVHQMTPEDPEVGVFGMPDNFLPAIEKALAGKSEGALFDFYAEAEDAFGPHLQENIYTVPVENLSSDGKLDPEVFAPGNYVLLQVANGYRLECLVLAVDDDSVTFDLNHPLAGARVHYVGKVLGVRDATDDELNPPACGGGCCGGNGSAGCCGDKSDKGGCCGGGCC